jgi:hypothetical protein
MNARVARRFGWIEGCLRYGGAFGVWEKKRYAYEFRLSPGQVSKDQKEFAIEMNRVAGETFIDVVKGRIVLVGEMPAKPRFVLPPHDIWLRVMIDDAYEVVPPIERAQPANHVLRAVVEGIQSKHPVQVRYYSRSQGMTTRTLSLHTLVFVVGRHHVRAYDHQKTRYADFVLSRIDICAPDTSGTRYVGKEQDSDWHSLVKVEIASAERPLNQGVQMDFGLDLEGKATRQVRKALAPYLVDTPEAGYVSPVRVREI